MMQHVPDAHVRAPDDAGMSCLLGITHADTRLAESSRCGVAMSRSTATRFMVRSRASRVRLVRRRLHRRPGRGSSGGESYQTPSDPSSRRECTPATTCPLGAACSRAARTPNASSSSDHVHGAPASSRIRRLGYPNLPCAVSRRHWPGSALASSDRIVISGGTFRCPTAAPSQHAHHSAVRAVLRSDSTGSWHRDMVDVAH